MQARLAQVVALLALLALPAGGAFAGGPLALKTDGTPFVWSTAAAIPYRTDNGPLSASVNESEAHTLVDSMFDVWQNVASATLSYTRAGFINAVGAFTNGDVDTLAEYNAVVGDCVAGNQNPVIYDADASILEALGKDVESVIGFAGFCALDTGTGEIVSSHVVMNGLFQDGTNNPVPDLSAAEFDATFIHEFGHFSGLDHSQINVGCASGFCGSDDLAGLPTMFPFIASETQRSLSVDDIAWISRLYPAAGGSGFAATHGTISGTVYFSDGESHARFVNVVARLVDNPGTAGINESRTTAGAGVSGYKFRFFNGNPINDPDGDGMGTQAPGDIGLYEISVPPGNYMIEVESVDEQFTEGSSVGGPFRIPMPGTAPAPIGPISVAAGATSSGNDVTLIGSSDARFDQFEGP